ncbi:MAG: pilus assembly protein PilZ [Spirochaetaceae bacterium]|jgi:hypothetical protein|nr:pilus assembly protein PilZ [Spirochaetaceae bacterium]
MGVITSQKITSFYERFKAIDVTFSKEIIRVTGLVSQQVYLKCGGDFWPCVIYSSSFETAKIAANVQSGLVEKLRQANNVAGLRFCFKTADVDTPVTFFVSARVCGYSPYGNSKDIALFSLQFTQRPPDDLIGIIGTVLDANVNSAKRSDERILLTVDSIRKLGILSKETAVFIQGVPRRCILRDVSFSGAKLIMMGIAKFLINREAALRVDFDDPRESFLLRGSFVRSEEVEGRKEMIALAIKFAGGGIPMGYKVRLNNYLTQLRVEYKPESSAPAGTAATGNTAVDGARADSTAAGSAAGSPAALPAVTEPGRAEQEDPSAAAGDLPPNPLPKPD